MAGGERFVVLGLAPVRSEWFRSVGRWAHEAAIPVEFIKCISATEVVGRINTGRPFSALLIDASAPGIDRDLLELAVSHGCAPIVVDHGLVERDWRALGASAVLPERFDTTQLLSVLDESAQPILRASARPVQSGATEGFDIRPGGRTIAVTGAGGMGTSTIAMALAQGLAQFPEHRTVLLADMALRSSQAMMHDARDMIPSLTELVESHRLGVPADSEIASTIYDLPDRGYHLLLGIRHERDWLTISARALGAAWRSLERIYETTVADITGDFDGAEQTGSNDIEDRNRLARAAAQRADVVLAVGGAESWGVHRLVRTIVALVESGVEPERILPCINRAPRNPRVRAEITAALADLVSSRVPDTSTMANPMFVPMRRQLESVLRDGEPLPAGLVDPVTAATRVLLERAERSMHRDALEPTPVAPGTLGTMGPGSELDG